MKTTEFLAVAGDSGVGRDRLVIHPNDGYDIGLMTTATAVRLFIGVPLEAFMAGNAPPENGTVSLSNECPCGTVRLHPARWRDLGRPEKIRLCVDGDKVLVSVS